MEEILGRIRKLRKEAKISQKEMSKRLGLGQTTYSAMERGSQRIFFDYLLRIAAILEIQIWQFFIEPEEIGGLDDYTQELVTMWKRFDRDEKALIFRMAQQIDEKNDSKQQLEKVDDEYKGDQDSEEKAKIG